MPRIDVREVENGDDLDVVLKVWAAANRTRQRPAGPLRSARVATAITEGEMVLLATYGQRSAGMAVAETFREGESTPDPRTGHIAMLAVDPAVWGSGVGTRLVRDLQQRWDRLSVWVRPDNKRATRLYLGCDFVDIDNVSQLQDGDEIRQFVWPASEL